MDFSNDRRGALASKNHFGIVGNGIYERFNVVIDFINNDLYLQPNNSYNDIFKPSKLGFSYIDRSQTMKSWIVTGLYKDSPAEKSGLKIDDKIITVNNVNVEEINYEKQKSFFNNLDEVNLKIKRDNSLIELNFSPKSTIINR